MNRKEFEAKLKQDVAKKTGCHRPQIKWRGNIYSADACLSCQKGIPCKPPSS